MIDIKAHLNNIALHHTIFDLPFAYIGALMASGGQPGFWNIVWITVALTSARAASLAIDNLADLKYDSQQPRMAYRAMVAGRISRREALVFIVLCFVVLIFAVAQLAPICMYLLPIAALPCIIYPFTKRFTGYCHVFLGIAIAMAPAGGWVAAGGAVLSPTLFVLCLSVVFWMAGFDGMYGAQDREFDMSQGLHSLATEHGARGAFHIAVGFHVVTFLAFIGAGVLAGIAWPYYIGVAIAGAVLIYQHRILRWNDFSHLDQSYFMRNGLVSIALFLFTWASYLVA